MTQTDVLNAGRDFLMVTLQLALPVLLFGLVAGVLCVLFVEWVEKVFRVDDPVGAFTVHGVNGVWGTLAVGLFAQNPYAAGSTSEGLFFGGGLSQLMPQVYGVLVVAAWTIITSGLVFGGLRLAGILRVTAEEEREGLDMGEHGSSAYHNEERAF